MERTVDLKRVLAEEIRAAIAETAPSPEDARATGDPATAQVRLSMRRAAEALTPSVPAGAPLEPAKRLVIRALRFLWRNQSVFNALSLDASSQLADAVVRLRAEMETLARRAGVQEARLTLAEATAPGKGQPRPVGALEATPPLPAGVYALFEERFRGSPAAIEAGQRSYLDLLREIPGPVLDVGCGRGEFLRLLRAAGIAGAGIESNPICVAACRGEGLDVEQGDALSFLSGRPAASLGAVVAFQVVEHWAPERIFGFLQQARRVLASGGLLVAETINADSLSALKAFYLDPTHVRPVPPEALRFLLEAAGFTDVRIEYRSQLPASERLEESSENERKLNALLFGAQDYAVIGRAAAAP